MVNIDVDVEDTGVIPLELGKLSISRNILKELENCDNDVVHVTKSGGFKLLGVMKATGPVNSNVCVLLRVNIDEG